MTQLADYCVYSYHSYRADFKKGLDHCLGDLVQDSQAENAVKDDDYDREQRKVVGKWTPPRIAPALSGKYRNERILKAVTRPYGTDFYVPLQRLIGGKQSDRCKTYSLTDVGMRLLKSANFYEETTDPRERYSYHLVLLLSSAARKRVSDALPEGLDIPESLIKNMNDKGKGKARSQFVVPVRVSDLFVYHFSTNRVICQLSLEPVLPDDFPMTSTLFTEIVDQVGRFPHLGWLEKSPTILKDKTLPKLVPVPGFTIGSLVARFLFGANGYIATSFRTFTYSFAQVALDQPETTKSDLVQLGTRLARQYTGDYAISEDASGIYKVADFDNVVHITSREGAATVIDPRTNGKNIDFLFKYRSGILVSTHLPLVVVNLHQHCRALEIGAQSVLATADYSNADAPSYDTIENEHKYQDMISDWNSLQRDLALLNSRFRFRQVSQVSMHHSFNKALRSSFDLDDLENQLGADMSEISNTMQMAILIRNQKRKREFDRRYSWLPIVAASFASSSLALDFIQTYISLLNDNSPLIPWKATIFFSLFLALSIGLTYWYTKKKPSD